MTGGGLVITGGGASLAGGVDGAADGVTGTGVGAGVVAGCGSAMVAPVGRPRFAITTPATTPRSATRPMTSAPAKTRVGEDVFFGGTQPGGRALSDAPSIVRIEGPVGGPSPGAAPGGMFDTIACGPVGVNPGP